MRTRPCLLSDLHNQITYELHEVREVRKFGGSEALTGTHSHSGATSMFCMTPSSSPSRTNLDIIDGAHGHNLRLRCRVYWMTAWPRSNVTVIPCPIAQLQVEVAVHVLEQLECLSAKELTHDIGLITIDDR